MEKLKITKEHKKALDYWKSTANSFDWFVQGGGSNSSIKCLYAFTPEQFALLLCGWYEVDKNYKVDDWVYNKKMSMAGKVTRINKDIIHVSEMGSYGTDYVKLNFRKATPDEIAQEKERRKWTELGRDVNQYKNGDVVKHKDFDCLCEVIDSGISVAAITTDFSKSERVVDTHWLKLVTPVEKRLDKGDSQ